jgi:hypothetical protein
MKNKQFDEEDIIDIVDEALDESFINTDERLIIWPSGERLTLDQTAEKINNENNLDNEVIKDCIMAWIEMKAQPEATNKKQEEILFEDIKNWVNDYYSDKKGYKVNIFL